ncbi:MAG: hypothetical protein BIFFINMI_04029 [Phycisphaerae bacterium]|nr:hypothetical protein [Phycisphaerae bacterium]
MRQVTGSSGRAERTERTDRAVGAAAIRCVVAVAATAIVLAAGGCGGGDSVSWQLAGQGGGKVYVQQYGGTILGGRDREDLQSLDIANGRWDVVQPSEAKEVRLASLGDRPGPNYAEWRQVQSAVERDRGVRLLNGGWDGYRKGYWCVTNGMDVYLATRDEGGRWEAEYWAHIQAPDVGTPDSVIAGERFVWFVTGGRQRLVLLDTRTLATRVIRLPVEAGPDARWRDMQLACESAGRLYYPAAKAWGTDHPTWQLLSRSGEDPEVETEVADVTPLMSQDRMERVTAMCVADGQAVAVSVRGVCVMPVAGGAVAFHAFQDSRAVPRGLANAALAPAAVAAGAAYVVVAPAALLLWALTAD